jgi:hypothetical protein
VNEAEYLDAIQKLFKPWLINLPDGARVIAESGDGRSWYYIAANGAGVRIDKPEEFGEGSAGDWLRAHRIAELTRDYGPGNPSMPADVFSGTRPWPDPPAGAL